MTIIAPDDPDAQESDLDLSCLDELQAELENTNPRPDYNAPPEPIPPDEIEAMLAELDGFEP
jgi:hypothetical protein